MAGIEEEGGGGGGRVISRCREINREFCKMKLRL